MTRRAHKLYSIELRLRFVGHPAYFNEKKDVLQKMYYKDVLQKYENFISLLIHSSKLSLLSRKMCLLNRKL